jgi:hypothetical protein
MFDKSCCRSAAIGVALDVDVEVAERDVAVVNIFMDEDVFGVVDVAAVAGDAKCAIFFGRSFSYGSLGQCFAPLKVSSRRHFAP